MDPLSHRFFMGSEGYVDSYTGLISYGISFFDFGTGTFLTTGRHLHISGITAFRN